MFHILIKLSAVYYNIYKIKEMTSKEKFDLIAELTPLLNKMNVKGALIGYHDKIRIVMKEILPQQQLDMACSSCIQHYLNVMLSHYGTQYPKYLESIQPQQTVEPKAKKTRTKKVKD